jgi:hypothetical protein
MLLVYAWYVETYGLQHFSDLSRYGIYISAYGVGFIYLASFYLYAGR